MISISSSEDAQRAIPLPKRDAFAASSSAITRVMREPLLHFIVAGAVLFFLYGWLQPERFASDKSHRIEFSATDVDRIELAFIARWQRPPTPAELQGLLASEVRNEIMSREAIALGLDRDDAIVKRRLAQKMEFLVEDLAGLREPSQAELRDWFEKNKDEFAQPSRITFRHVFFSIDRRGINAESAARKALASASSRSDMAPRGDAFMFQDFYRERTPAQLADVFGSDFAKVVFTSPQGRWSGPFASGLGWHVVWTEAIQTGVVPAYEDVESQVRERWTSDQREAAKRANFEVLMSRYEVVLPGGRALPVSPQSSQDSAK